MQTWCSPDLFGFEWVDGRQVVAGLHRVGDRVAVGAEHAAFERRAILARSPHQPYAVKMDRERELKIIRRAYAKQVKAAAGVGDPQVEAAFAAVAREDFLGPGPLAHRALGRRLSCDAGCRPDLPVHSITDQPPIIPRPAPSTRETGSPPALSRSEALVRETREPRVRIRLPPAESPVGIFF
jgi:hypothetical protein